MSIPVTPAPAALPADDLSAAVALVCLDTGLLSPAETVALLRRAGDTQRSPVTGLLSRAGLPETLGALAGLLGTEYVDLESSGSSYRIDDELIDRCDPDRLRALTVLPVTAPDSSIVAVAANPLDVEVVDYLRGVFGPGRFRLAIGLAAQVQDVLALRTFTPDAPDGVGDDAERQAILDWVANLLTRAVAERASDLHIQYDRAGRLRVRFRIDGSLRPGPAAPPGREIEVVGALMNRSGMDVANLLSPQDGTFNFAAAGRSVDARASMIPQDTGPSLVIRLLDTATTRLVLEDLGVSSDVAAALRRHVASSHGTIITAGPTGAGKTTTMWALLRELDPDIANIVTIEDPIEYRLAGVGQTQVRTESSGRLNFARALRAILRHDPDVILVGEIRDAETATVAMEAAITGHLVLSTIHAPSAPAVFNRFVQMGVARYMVAEALTAVCSQRLLRRLHGCATAEAPTEIEAAHIRRWGLDVPSRVWRPTGCPSCNQTGYLGRVVVMELLETSAELREALANQATMGTIESIARASGWQPLVADAVRHVAVGTTSMEEVLRVLSDQEDHD